jgi:hypothetical protein
MLSDLETGVFHAFGFVVLRACLSPAEVTRLDEAYTRAIATAPAYDYFGAGGTRMLVHAEEADDSIAALVGHPRIDEAIRDLFGRSDLFINSDLWRNMDDTLWHSDGAPGRQPPTFKVAFYLDPTSPSDGGLRVVPGSHHPAFCAAILDRCGVWDRRRLPGCLVHARRA